MPTVDNIVPATDTIKKLTDVVNQVVDIINNDVVVANLPMTGNVVTTGSMGANSATFNTVNTTLLTADTSNITNLTANAATFTTSNTVTATTRTLTSNTITTNTISGSNANFVTASIPNFFSNNIVANNVTANNRITTNSLVANSINVASINISTAFTFTGDLSVNNIRVSNTVTTKAVSAQTVTANGAVNFTGTVTAGTINLTVNATSANSAVRKVQLDNGLAAKANSVNPSFSGNTSVSGNLSVVGTVTSGSATFNTLSVTTTSTFGGTITATSGIHTRGDIISRRGTTNAGYYFFGNGTHSIGYDGSNILLSTTTRIAGNLVTTAGSTFQGNGDIYMAWAGKSLSTVLDEKAPKVNPEFIGSIVRVSGATPRYEMLWPGTYRKDMRLTSAGEVQFVNTDNGAVTHGFRNNGSLWTSQIGDVAASINNVGAMANDRVHRVGVSTSYGEINVGLFNWTEAPQGTYVCGVYTNAYFGISIIRYRRIMQHVPSLGGWVAAYVI